MRIKYPQAIQESEEELTRLEQSLRGQKPADRVRVLRLLKSGAVKSLKDCAPLVGYSVTQLPRFRPKSPLFNTSPRPPQGDCWSAVGESHSTHREPWDVAVVIGRVALPCPSA